MRALYLEVRNLCAKFIHTLATKKYRKIIFWGSFDSPTFRKVLNLCLVILSGQRLNQAGWKCVCCWRACTITSALSRDGPQALGARFCTFQLRIAEYTFTMTCLVVLRSVSFQAAC